MLTKLSITTLFIFNVCVLKVQRKCRGEVCEPLPLADACFHTYSFNGSVINILSMIAFKIKLCRAPEYTTVDKDYFMLKTFESQDL